MGIFPKPQQEPYHLQLTRKKAEYAALKSLLDRGESIPGFWIEEFQKLAGEIAVLEEKLAAERKNPTWTESEI